MAASATLTIPMMLATPVQADDATRAFAATAGLKNATLDAAGGKATVDFEFPGNVDALMRRLAGKGLTTSGTIAISVPVVNLTGRVIDAVHLVESLNASPAVSNAGYDGKTVTATIVAATNAVRYMYEEIIIAGLMALDVPTIAAPSEFVL